MAEPFCNDATRKLRVLYSFVQRFAFALSNHTPRTVKSVWTLMRHFAGNLNALVAQWAEFERLDSATPALASTSSLSEDEGFPSQAEYEWARDMFRFYVVEALSQAMRLPVSRNSRVLARLQLQLLGGDDRLPFVAKTLNVLRVPRSYTAAQLLWAVARVGDSDPWSGEFALEQGDDCPDRRRQCAAIALDSVRAFPELDFIDDDTWCFLSGNCASTDRFIMVVNGATPLDPATTDCGEYDYSPDKFTEAFAVLELLDGFLHFRFVTGDEVPALRELLTSSDGEWLFPTSAPAGDQVARGSTIADGNFALLFHRLIFPLDIREARRLHPTESERLRLWEPLYFSAAHWVGHSVSSLNGCPVASTHLDKFLFGERDASAPRLEPQIVQPHAAPTNVPVPRLAHQLRERIFGGEVEKDAAKSQKLLAEAGTLEQFDEAFVIEEYLGALGLSVLATDRKTGEQVVVKVIEKPSGSSRDYKRDVHQFTTYVSTMWEVGKQAYAASLAGGETHVVGVVGVYESSRDVLVVQEHCSGRELFDWLQARDEPITEEVMRDVVRQMLLGLSELHDRGLPHGDIKPSNIFVDTRGEPSVRVHLFGCAPLWTANENSMFTAKEFACQFFSPELTLTIVRGANPFGGDADGNVSGVDSDYDSEADDVHQSMLPGRGTSMDPMRAKLSRAADVWSVGVVTFLALFGKLPFAAPEDDVERSQTSVQRDIIEFRANECDLLLHTDLVSAAARQFLGRLLNHEPADRVTVEEALAQPWIKGEEAEVDEQPRMERAQTQVTDALPSTTPVRVRGSSEQVRLSRDWSKHQVLSVQSAQRKQKLKGFTAEARFHNQIVIELANNLPASEVARLRKIFQRLDKNDDKVLSRDELRNGLRELVQVSRDPCELDVDALFNIADLDNSGDIDFHELLVAMQRLRYANLEMSKMVFSVFDEDDDKVLTPEEIVRLLPRFSLAEAKKVVGHNGTMSRNEFIDSWRRSTWQHMYKHVQGGLRDIVSPAPGPQTVRMRTEVE